MPKSVELGFKWTSKHDQALRLLFEGRLSQAAIAEKCGIALRTLEYWIAHPDFQQRLTAMRENLLVSLLDQGVAYVSKEQRIIALAQMAESARAEYEAHPLLKETRPIPRCDEPLVNESFNRDAFECFRGALDDIAKELGQRKTGNDTTVNVQQQQVLFVLPEKTMQSVTHVIEEHQGVALPPPTDE